MAKLALITLLVIGALADTWTGKLDKVYELSELNLFAEGVHYYDGDLYTGSAAGQDIHRFDPDDLDVSKALAAEKTSDAHDAGTANVTLGLCSSGSKDRIYAALGKLAGTSDGGIAYWNDDLEFQKAVTISGQVLMNDCVVKGDYVYFTGSRAGPSVMVCDLDLTDCKTLY